MKGFTLIELMIVIVIVAILATITMSSYQIYVRQANAHEATQEMQRLAVLLERYRAKNFSYKDFPTTTLATPKGVSKTTKYKIYLLDTDAQDFLTSSSSQGRRWSMVAESIDPKNYSFLLTNTGIRCKNKASQNIQPQSCGVGGESW